jgi:hypothetical protein
MADQKKYTVNKSPIETINSEKGNGKKFKIKKDKSKDSDGDIEINVSADGYVVESLSLVGLPDKMADGTSIQWFHSFAVKKNGQYLKDESYSVTIKGLSNRGKSQLVVLDSSGILEYFKGTISGDTISLTDGDPAIGRAP